MQFFIPVVTSRTGRKLYPSAVASGGYCLFRAVGRGLQISAGQARNDATAEMQRQLVSGVADWWEYVRHVASEKTPEDCIANVRKDKVWGGAMELQALSNFHQRRICAAQKFGKQILWRAVEPAAEVGKAQAKEKVSIYIWFDAQTQHYSSLEVRLPRPPKSRGEIEHFVSPRPEQKRRTKKTSDSGGSKTASEGEDTPASSEVVVRGDSAAGSLRLENENACLLQSEQSVDPAHKGDIEHFASRPSEQRKTRKQPKSQTATKPQARMKIRQ